MSARARLIMSKNSSLLPSTPYTGGEVHFPPDCRCSGIAFGSATAGRTMSGGRGAGGEWSTSGYGGASQSRPISARCFRIARRSQTCTAGPSSVDTARREPSGVNVANFTGQESGLSSRARVRAVSVSTRRRTLLESVLTTSRLSGTPTGSAFALTYNHNGKRLAFAGRDRPVWIQELPLGGERLVICNHMVACASSRFSRTTSSLGAAEEIRRKSPSNQWASSRRLIEAIARSGSLMQRQKWETNEYDFDEAGIARKTSAITWM